jgi:hypothetical protein
MMPFEYATIQACTYFASKEMKIGKFSVAILTPGHSQLPLTMMISKRLKWEEYEYKHSC